MVLDSFEFAMYKVELSGDRLYYGADIAIHVQQLSMMWSGDITATDEEFAAAQADLEYAAITLEQKHVELYLNSNEEEVSVGIAVYKLLALPHMLHSIFPPLSSSFLLFPPLSSSFPISPPLSFANHLISWVYCYCLLNCLRYFSCISTKQIHSPCGSGKAALHTK